MRPLEMVSKFKILPRDLRLLKTRGANIAVRPDYFLFRLPPFTGCVRRDSCLLLTDGPSAATDVLQDSLLSQIKLPTEEDQLQTTPFELRVLETALREDLLSKQERFTPNPNPNPDPNPDANPDPAPALTPRRTSGPSGSTTASSASLSTRPSVAAGTSTSTGRRAPQSSRSARQTWRGQWRRRGAWRRRAREQ